MTPTDWKNTNTLQDPTLTHTFSFIVSSARPAFDISVLKRPSFLAPGPFNMSQTADLHYVTRGPLKGHCSRKNRGLHTGRAGMPAMQTYCWAADFPLWRPWLWLMSLFPKEPLYVMLCSCMLLQWSKEMGQEQSTTSKSSGKNFLTLCTFLCP